MSGSDNTLLTFGGHLEVLRRALVRILAVTGVLAVGIFCFKEFTWRILLAPSECGFCTYRWIESVLATLGSGFRFEEFQVDLIATELASQFMTHITTSIYLALLCASPYILYELFAFASPALYENERRYSVRALAVVYALFMLGLLMSYFVLFPISFRFLGTYSVAERIHSTITLDSYIGTFVTLSFVKGVVFQLPVVAFALAKMGFITGGMLARYRRHALIVIMFVSAFITPPDLLTLVLVTVPLMGLYEVSRWVAAVVSKK